MGKNLFRKTNEYIKSIGFLDYSNLDQDDLYVSLFENNHAVMLLIDPETGEIKDANPAATSFYGYSREEIKRKNITDINQLSKKEVYKEMQRAKKGQKKCFNFRHRLATGEIRDVECYSGTINYENQKILYSIVHDFQIGRNLKEKSRKHILS